MKSIQKRYQLLDVLWKIQDSDGYISDKKVGNLASQLGISKIEVEGMISFYHFFKRSPSAKFTIYLNNSIVSKFSGFSKVKKALEQATGVLFGQKDPSGTFELHETSCIGLSDMEPSALINFRAFVNLTAQKVHQLIFDLKAGIDIDKLCDRPTSQFHYKPTREKKVFLRKHLVGNSLQKLIQMSPDEVISEIKEGGLTGLGGAFFPTYIKWQGCKDQKATPKYVVCNADEGEPGTFKDRILLKHYPGLLLEGMTIGAYAIGAEEGIIYLRAEYRYLKEKIKKIIKAYKELNWLGKDILGIKGFNFNIRIQMGAGAYVCGEETALLQSMEGYRGEPRPRVYLPIEKGFLGKPTIVNNVETFCGAARIIELGSDYLKNTGVEGSIGTKLISVSGDCQKPGIYEIEWGMSVRELLKLCGAEHTLAVQVSGPSGEIISEKEFDRKIALNDLRCGGSFMIFNKDRDLLEIIRNFNQFFIDESCGVCTPCRAGNFILSRQLNKVKRGLLDHADIDQIKDWSKIMKYSSRCGLGQTAPNSILYTLEKFPELFEKYIAPDSGLNTSFDLEEAVKEYDLAIQNHNEI